MAPEKSRGLVLGEWKIDVGFVSLDSPLVNMRLQKTVELNLRLDVGKGVFIDPAPWGDPWHPLPQEHMDVLLTFISDLRKLEVQRKMEAMAAQMEEILSQNEALKAEVFRLKNTEYTPPEEVCRGGCSRGGDGPSCKKPGCRG